MDISPPIIDYPDAEALAQIKNQMKQLTELVNDIDRRVNKTVDQRINDIESRFIKKLDEERFARKESIASLSTSLDDFRSKTDKSLDTISGGLSNVNTVVTRLDGTINNWNRVVDVAQENFQKAQMRLDEADVKIDTVMQKQTRLEEQQRQFHKTIHGDSSEDGPDSLFKAIANVGITMKDEFASAKMQTDTVLTLARDNAKAIEKIERERAEEKERWSKRWSTAQTYLLQATGTPWIWITLIISIVGLFVTINPATQDFFTGLVRDSLAYLSDS